MSNLPPFYIGQKVVYIGDYNGIPKETPIIVSNQVRLSCGCWVVHCGFLYGHNMTIFCHEHSSERLPESTALWIYAKNLIPIEQTFQSISFKEVIKIELPLIGIN